LEVTAQALDLARAAALQAVRQDHRPQGRRGHPLAVHRVEGAGRVAGDEQALRHPFQFLVVAGAGFAGSWSHAWAVRASLRGARLRRLVRLGEARDVQAAGEVAEAGLVRRRVVLAAASQRYHPLAALDRRDHSAAFADWWGALDVQRFPAAVEVRRWAHHTAR